MKFCDKCGEKLQDESAFCPKCGAKVVGSANPQPKVREVPLGDSAGMRMVIPIGCSGWTIAAGYCGLLSFIPLIGLLLAVLSIVFGILGICVIRKNPHKHGVARIVIGWIFAIPSLIGHVIWFLWV